jgi:hypothetical protein
MIGSASGPRALLAVALLAATLSDAAQAAFGGFARQLEKLQTGSTLVLVVRVGEREFGRYTFDIRNLRYAPDAVDASKGVWQP